MKNVQSVAQTISKELTSKITYRILRNKHNQKKTIEDGVSSYDRISQDLSGASKKDTRQTTASRGARVKKVTVKQGEDEQVPVDVIASSIKAISEGVSKLMSGSLNEKAVVLLIQHAAPNVGGRYGQSKVGTTEIRAVLGGIQSLEQTYLKKKKP